MKLPRPEFAVVPREKIAGYLLSFSHQTGRAKAEFFSRFGFTAEAWEVLARALLSHGAAHEVAKMEASPLGTRYIIEGALESPDGRRPMVRAVWFVDEGEEVPRFVTAYPCD